MDAEKDLVDAVLESDVELFFNKPKRLKPVFIKAQNQTCNHSTA